MNFKICPAEAGNVELEFELKIIEDRAILIPVFKCGLCGSRKVILE